ncbi:MAG: nicotinate-nucleotide adenylyltransferase [bacterium]
MTATQRVGIFGGTFNPIHIAHLVLAQTALETLQLQQVIFIPTGEPPHKRARKDLAPAEDRYRMVQLAIAGNEQFSVSRREIDTDGPSYTIKTLETIEKNLEPDCEIYLLVGGDWAGQIQQWHRGKEILQRYRVAAVQRGNHNTEGDSSLLAIAMPTIDISSSMIRQILRDGRDARYLVPEPVARYIAEHDLYRR